MAESKETKSLDDVRTTLQTVLGLKKSVVVSEHHDYWLFLIQLFSNHCTWKNRLSEIEAFQITRAKTNQALLVKLKRKQQKRWITTSWRKAHSGQANKKCIDLLTAAMRHAIRVQIRKFRKTQRQPQCALCAQTPALYHVDHIVPFSHLKRDFLAQTQWETPVDDFRSGAQGQVRFGPKHKTFKTAWQRFHRQKATLQLLCPECNLKKSDRVT